MRVSEVSPFPTAASREVPFKNLNGLMKGGNKRPMDRKAEGAQLDRTGRGRPTENLSKYLFVVSAVGGVGLVISLFLATEFIGPIKKMVELSIQTIFG